MNKVLLLGNVGDAPRIKNFDNGGKVAQFSLATTKRGYTTKDGKEIADKTTWHNILVRQTGLAKVVEQYVKKGTSLFIEGEITNRDYTNANGVKKTITEIEVSELRLIGGKKESSPLEDLPI